MSSSTLLLIPTSDETTSRVHRFNPSTAMPPNRSSTRNCSAARSYCFRLSRRSSVERSSVPLPRLYVNYTKASICPCVSGTFTYCSTACSADPRRPAATRSPALP
jgi:hypothetical protein